jgi:NAD+ synthase (glutamine-hydrolysing)
MKYGFIKVAAGTPDIRVADCEYNAGRIIAVMREADAHGVKLLVLPELCITAYTCGDLFLHQPLLRGALSALATLLKESASNDMITIVGLPIALNGMLYNCAAVMQSGKLLGLVPKTHLPNYSEFYEKRHFTTAPAEAFQITLLGQQVPFGSKLIFKHRTMAGFSFAVEICEDLWVPRPPSISHAVAGAVIIANISASDETISKDEFRRELVTSQCARLVCGYIYSDAGEGESTTDMVFSGHNLIAENGVLLSESAPFSGKMAVSEIDVSKLVSERRRLHFEFDDSGYTGVNFDMDLSPAALTRDIPMLPFVPSDPAKREARCERIFNIQAAGLKTRLAASGVKTLVVGVSGGLDSCLALLVCVRAMDLLARERKQVIAVTMPCFGTTQRTKSNAELLCEQLHVTLRCIDITKAVKQHFEDIGHPEEQFDVTFENAQARERTQVLMDIANQTNGLVVGTGDLSELALGWATYNGDHMSMYGVNASIPKTLIRYMVEYAAGTYEGKLKNALLDILGTPVSPELLPPKDGQIAQKTESIVGPYELHDFFLYHTARFGFEPAKVLYLAEHAFKGVYERAVILKWLRTFYTRFFTHQFKRSCMPDGPKVGSVTLSPRGDLRMPSDAKSALWLSALNKLEE